MKLVKCCEGGFDCDGKIRAAREKEVLQQAATRSFRQRLGRNQEVLAERVRVGRQRIVFSLIFALAFPLLVLAQEKAGLGKTVTSFKYNVSNEWKDSGVTVKSGESVMITADGDYLWDPTLPRATPEGAKKIGSGKTYPASSVFNPSQFPLQEAPVASVIAMIGDSKYYVGKQATITPAKGGRIYIGLNDRLGNYDDNQGTVQITIQVGNGPVAASALAPDQSPDKKVEEEILKLHDKLLLAMDKGDAATAEQLVTDDFLITYLMPAKTFTKAAMKFALQSPATFTVEARKLDEVKVRVYGDAAVVTGHVTEARKGTDGKSGEFKGRFTDVWVKQNGKWLLASRHASPAYGVLKRE